VEKVNGGEGGAITQKTKTRNPQGLGIELSEVPHRTQKTGQGRTAGKIRGGPRCDNDNPSRGATEESKSNATKRIGRGGTLR